jgi:bifunctional non-homologous end joining protein LigD/DNA ligase-1
MLLQPLQPSDIKKGWRSSLKWDGFRILIHYDHGKVRAFSRHGTEVTDRFPELIKIKLPVKSAILDGECIVFDMTQPQDQPRKLWWDDSMARFNTKKKAAVTQISQTLKAHFPLWDVLYVDGQSLLKKSFLERRDTLNALVKSSDELSVTPMYEDGEDLFLKAKQMGMEGIVQYNPNASYYLDCRPKDVILKVKAYQYAICQISSIRRNGQFGWGLTMNGEYVGVMEFPPNTDAIRAFNKVSRQLIRAEKKDWLFLEPLLSCRVKFQCFTKEGKLRSPKFEQFYTLNSVESENGDLIVK